jgi:crotonobetainyl-CoA:carnitine CoA-transferase CaiB-like acyl-CoA transferase
VLRRLVRDADVLVESHRPGALDQQGIGYAQLREANPRLVWCSLTGFGQDGPYAQAPGHDITYLGAAGVLGRLSAPSVTPTPPQLTFAVPMGALMGVTGILAAIAQRDRTGAGAFVDASLTDAAMWSVSEDVARAAVAPAPSWPDMAGRWIYLCADGRSVTVAATEAKSWARLVAALDLPELADHRLGVDEPATIAKLTAAFATKPASAWLADPGFAGGVGPSNEPVDVLSDAQVLARDRVATIHGTGERVLGNPLRITGPDGASSSALTAAPALGEHTDALLGEAGFDPAEIAALRDAAVIG